MKKCLVSVLLFLALPLAHGNTFTVTNLDNSGPGSLREAVNLAEASPGPDLINFTVTGTIILTGGPLNIRDSLTILGPGADKLTIDGNLNNRIFTIVESNVPACPALTGPSDFLVTLSGMTITRGRRNSDNAGGAIFSVKSLHLDSVVVSDNRARSGAGLAILMQYPGQSLTIVNSTFADNVATPLSAVASNAHFGGGIAITENCGGSRTQGVTVSITDSTLSGNQVQPTTGNGSGGAMFSNSDADITITNSRVINNSVVAPDPPVMGATYYGGGFYGRAKSLHIGQSEVSGNSAFLGGGMRVINNLAGDQTPAKAMRLEIVNSTLSGNVAVPSTGGAIEAHGNIAIELKNTTISANTAPATGAGGIRVNVGDTAPTGNTTAAPTLTMASSILAGSLGGSVDLGPGNISNYVINASKSLVGVVGALVTVSGSGNLQGLGPQLAPLAFNGGLTRTHELLPGSPAYASGSNPLGLETDQRGFGHPRMFNAATDMGAFQSVAGSVFARFYVQKAYVAYYGRPADPAGQDYWAGKMDTEGSLASIIAAFGNSDEFNRRYGTLTAAQLITKIYQQALARDPDQGGLDYYVAELLAGRRTLQTITLDVLNGASTAPDSIVVANKLAVADYYTAWVALGCPYNGEQQGVDSIALVTADPATVQAALTAIDNRCGT